MTQIHKMKYTNTTETLLEPLNKTGAAATKASAARNLKKKNISAAQAKMRFGIRKT